jgi:DHA3 family tetracycline resistance protein-like MFS transporter
MRVPRREFGPYRLYLALACGTSFLLGITSATIAIYWVTTGRLNPLQLVLLGTALELSYFLFQLPTGVLADAVSRRLCVLGGLFVIGLALVIESSSAAFANLISAQAVLGLGYALNNGALEAWIADELALPPEVGGREADRPEGSQPEGGQPEGGQPHHHQLPIAGVYMRATQLGLVGTVAGSLLSGVIALGGLNLPLLIGGSLICLLALATALVMPERNFTQAAGAAGTGGASGAAGTGGAGGAAGAAGAAATARGPATAALLRQSRAALAGQLRATHRAIVAVPGLVLLFAMTMFAGLWSESFDRLWGALLIRDIGFPRLAGLSPAMWLSLLAATVAVLALGSTELARRRTERLGGETVAAALLVLTAAIGIGVVAMATTRVFAVAVAAYLGISVLRPVFDPLIDGWMVTRIEPSVRATALSARDMFDSGGQIFGGPVVGVIGALTSVRIGLLAGAAALAPAAGCLGAASRRIRSRPALAAAGQTDATAATAAPGLH